jgi:hypothetical protein
MVSICTGFVICFDKSASPFGLDLAWTEEGPSCRRRSGLHANVPLDHEEQKEVRFGDLNACSFLVSAPPLYRQKLLADMQVRSLRSFSQTVFHKTLHCLSAQECCIPISIPSGHSMLPGLDSIERTMQCCGDGVRIGGECGHFDSRALLDAVRKVPHMTEAQRLGLLLLLTIRHMQRLREQVFRDTNYKSSKTCEIQDKNSNIEAAGDFRDETYGRICEESEWFVEEALWTSFPLMDGGESGQSGVFWA